MFCILYGTTRAIPEPVKVHLCTASQFTQEPAARITRQSTTTSLVEMPCILLSWRLHTLAKLYACLTQLMFSTDLIITALISFHLCFTQHNHISSNALIKYHFHHEHVIIKLWSDQPKLDYLATYTRAPSWIQLLPVDTGRCSDSTHWGCETAQERIRTNTGRRRACNSHRH